MQQNNYQAVDLSNVVSVEINAEPAEIVVGGNGYSGSVQIQDAIGNVAVHLEGDNSDIFIADIEKEVVNADQLEDLQDMATFLSENQHLPDFPSAEMLRPGYRVKQFMIKLIRMNEYLVLKTAEMEQRISELEITD